MIYSDAEEALYLRVLDFATRRHAGQFRRGGAPYVTHPIAVADTLRREGRPMTYLLAALCHDLLEDTGTTGGEIADLAGEETARIVALLTKPKDYRNEIYVAGIRSDPAARAVKGADRLHNLRSALVADEAFRRKYVEETVRWFWDLHPDIPGAVRALAATLPDGEELLRAAPGTERDVSMGPNGSAAPEKDG